MNQQFRAQRGGTVYETVGIASESEIEEVRELAVRLSDRVNVWMKAQHKELL